MLEIQTNGISFNGHVIVNRTGIGDILLIGNAEGRKTQSKTAILFIAGVNIVSIADIDGHRQPCVGKYLGGL